MELIRMFSFWGDTVLDPFCGSGTTMVAAMKGNRNSIGLEIDSAYCRMAANRLKDENQNLFSTAHIEFLKPEESRQEGPVLKEAQEIYSKVEKKRRRSSKKPRDNARRLVPRQ